METLTGEVLDIRNEFGSYAEFKTAFDKALNGQAELFVLTGYLIKKARDTDILKESGYRDYNEFAAAEYGLDKSQVSRYIGINDEFSENGYSDRLQERYKNFGYTKLAIMLTLPAAVNEELTAAYSKSEIMALKSEVDEEKKITELEIMMEPQEPKLQDCDSIGTGILYQIGKNDPGKYLQLHEAVCTTYGYCTGQDQDPVGYETVMDEAIYLMADILAPAGEGVISVHVPGKGGCLLSIKGKEKDPVVTNVLTETKEKCGWVEIVRSMYTLCCDREDARLSWEKLYGKDFPEKDTVAPVQPKKPSRVTVSKPQTPKTTKEDKSLTSSRAEETVRGDLKAAAEYPKSGTEPTKNGTEPTKNGTEDHGNAAEEQKEEKTNHDENMEVAPVQPDNPAQQKENSGDTAQPADDGNGAGSADDASASGTGDGSPQRDAADTAGITEKPPAAVLTENAVGQMEITNYPGIVPDNTAAEQKKTAVDGYLTALRDNLDKIYILAERGEYRNAENWLEAVRGTIHKIKEVSEAQDDK